MKKHYYTALCITVMSMFNLANAAPVQYRLTAVAADNTVGGLIFGSGDTLTATFFYDAEVSPDQSNDIETTSWAQYTNAITDFHATINGFSIDSPNHTVTPIYNVSYGDTYQKYMSVTFDGPTAHTVIDNHIYTVASFFLDHRTSTFPDHSLPSILTLDNPGTRPFTLQIYVDQVNQAASPYISQLNITDLTVVPLPSSSLLFGSGIIALLRRRRRTPND